MPYDVCPMSTRVMTHPRVVSEPRPVANLDHHDREQRTLIASNGPAVSDEARSRPARSSAADGDRNRRRRRPHATADAVPQCRRRRAHVDSRRRAHVTDYAVRVLDDLPGHLLVSRTWSSASVCATFVGILGWLSTDRSDASDAVRATGARRDVPSGGGDRVGDPRPEPASRRGRGSGGATRRHTALQ